MITLWDLLKPVTDALRGRPPVSPFPRPIKPIIDRRVTPSQAPTHLAPIPNRTPSHPAILETVVIPRRPANQTSPLRQAQRDKPARKPHGASMQDRYDEVVRQMLAKYDVRVRKWRTSSSGVAWMVQYRDGRIQRLIESPKPKGPMSIAIFLHEIGHHAIGLGAFKPRCLEEYHAWKFSLDRMAELDLNITDAVRTRMRRSLEYAVRKAVRRGIKNLPPELEPYA